MNGNNIKLLLFDFDGTLVNTTPLILRAFRATWEKVFGFVYEDAQYIKTFGLLLPKAMRLLTEQAPEGTRAWLIGHVARWEKTAAQLLWLTLTKEAQETLAGVHTLALWFTLEADVSFRGSLACVDGNAAKALHRYLNHQLGKPEELAKLFRVGPETEAVTQELARVLRCNLEQRGVRIHANLDKEFLNRTFLLSSN